MMSTLWVSSVTDTIAAAGAKALRPTAERQAPALALTQFPAEVLEHIAGHVDSLHDLCSLSSTCSLLRNQLFPTHITLWTFRCGYMQEALVEKLLQRPALAACIRSLVLDDAASDEGGVGQADSWSRATGQGALEGGEEEHEAVGNAGAGADVDAASLAVFLPPNVRHDLTSLDELHGALRWEESLTRAISHMVRLQRLIYRHPAPLRRNDFWRNLWASCPRLADVEVAGFCGTPDAQALDPDFQPSFEVMAERIQRFVRPPIYGSALFEARKLRRFVFYTVLFSKSRMTRHHAQAATSLRAATAKLEQGLLRQNPDLEELRFGRKGATDEGGNGKTYVSHLLGLANWPNLRVLELVDCRAHNIDVLDFLQRHPTLKVVQLWHTSHLGREHLPMRGLPADGLPKLRHFRGSTTNCAALLDGAKREELKQLSGLTLPAPEDNNVWGVGVNLHAARCLASAPHLDVLDMTINARFGPRVADFQTIFEGLSGVRVLRLETNYAEAIETMLPGLGQLRSLESLRLPLHQMSAAPAPERLAGSMGLQIRSGGGVALASSSPFVASLRRKVQLVAEACPRLRRVEFGGGEAGMAVVRRYAGSDEVEEVRMVASSAAAVGATTAGCATTATGRRTGGAAREGAVAGETAQEDDEDEGEGGGALHAPIEEDVDGSARRTRRLALWDGALRGA